MTGARQRVEKKGTENMWMSGTDRLMAELGADSAREPVEDGVDHEAENTLARASWDTPGEDLLPILNRACAGSGSPNRASPTLRCPAQPGSPGTAERQARLVRDTLTQGNPEMRDAGVQVVEHGADPGPDDALKSHLKSHPEGLPWLREYIQGVPGDPYG